MAAGTLAELLDVPIESLPFVDEHSTTIVATPETVWDALIAVTWGTTAGSRSARVARGLGCVPAEPSGERGEIGSTVPGFIVTRAVRPAVLALMGEHRFSRYALVFCLTDTPTGIVGLSATTRAVFPGRAGTAYRLAVIGTRGHVLATRAILRAVRRRAERGRSNEEPG